jgi:hypothetical protein
MSVTFRSDLLSTDKVSLFFPPLTISMFVGNGADTPGYEDQDITNRKINVKHARLKGLVSAKVAVATTSGSVASGSMSSTFRTTSTR